LEFPYQQSAVARSDTNPFVADWPLGLNVRSYLPIYDRIHPENVKGHWAWRHRDRYLLSPGPII